VFQRTPPWVFPHNNRPIREWERRLYSRSKLAQRLMRGGIYSGREVAVLGFVKNPRFMGVAERMAKRHMQKQIWDPELLKKVTPDYTIGCKRILPSNKWYPALGEPNVELVTSGVKEVRGNAVVDEDGVEREVDAIVFGTGFHVTDMPVAHAVRGRAGQTLEEHWKGSPRAHLGLTIDDFPNFFLMLGPNTGLGHSSMVYMIESQIAHVMDALRALDANGAEILEVREDVLERYNAKVDEQLDGTVWNTGCKSWYLDATGRNSTLWPDWTWRFRQRAAGFDPAHYRLEAA
jgi:cation diffusion facilitator CzcD-associated flavoprotein CzcO